MSFFAALVKRYPNALTPLAKNMANPKMSLNELRSEIWKLRTEFWARKITTYPQVVRAAKGEAQEFINVVQKPGEMTYRHLSIAAAGGLQIFGAFCVGEILAKDTVVGYKVGDESH